MSKDDDLKFKFHDAMMRIDEKAKKCGYPGSQLTGMIASMGGLETAQRLLSEPKQSGLTELYLLKRLDLSVEYLVLRPEWSSLFTDKEKDGARKRLNDNNFDWEDGKL